MKYVAIYRRGGISAPLTVIQNARIRQIGTAEELGIAASNMIFVQIERIGYGYDYYSASVYRVMEVEKDG